MSQITKIIDERETHTQKTTITTTTTTEKKNKRTRGTEAIANGWEINDFVERWS